MYAQRSPWDEIANFEAHDIVRSRYLHKHHRELNAATAREIAAPFIQARHYYQSAEGADRTVKPLLLYYGVISLSRGLVLYLTGRREATLSQSHGLSVAHWQSVFSAPNPDFSQLMITASGSGSFGELVNATENRNLLRSNSSGINLKLDLEPVPVGSAFNFGEILAGLPELSDQIRHWIPPRCFAFSHEKSANTDETTLKIPRRYPSIDERLVVSTIGQGNCRILSCDEKIILAETTNGGKLSADLTDLTLGQFAGVGTLYMAQKYSSGVSLNKITQIFAISYIIGMLVRYYPSTWIDLIHQRIGDSSSPTITSVIYCIEKLFPSLVVDFLQEIR